MNLSKWQSLNVIVSDSEASLNELVPDWVSVADSRLVGIARSPRFISTAAHP